MAHSPVHPLISGVFLILALCIHPIVAIAAATPAIPEQPVLDATFPIDGEPFRVVAGDGAVWVTTGYRSVVKLDADSGEVLATVRLPGQPWDLAVDGDTVWVLTPDGGGIRKIVVPTMSGSTTPGQGRLAVAGLHRIDTSSSEVVETIPVELYGGGLAVTDGAVWVGAAAAAEGEPGMLLRVDPASSAVVASIPIDDAFVRVSAVSASDDGVWAIAQTDSAPAPAMLVLVDPETSAVLQTVRLESGMWDGSTLAAVPGAVWLTSFDLREPRPVATLVRVDAGTGAVTSREIEGFTHSLAFGDGRLWLADCMAATVTSLDPETGDATAGPVVVGEPVPADVDPWTQPIDGASCPQRPAVSEDAVWVPIPGDGVVVRLRP